LYEKTNDNAYIQRAFQWSDQSRSVVLRSMMQLDKVRAFAGVPDSIVQKDDIFRQKIAAFENALRLGKNTSETNQTSLELQKTRLLHKQFLQAIEKKYPNYYALKYQKNDFSQQQINSKLPENRSVLEYFIGENDCYAFLINRNGMAMRRLAFYKDTIEHWAKETLQFAKGKAENQQKYQQNAHLLYDALILSFEPSLKEEVVIIPDGHLANLPFEVLLSESHLTLQGVGTLSYWIKKHHISYHYSAALLFNTLAQKSNGEGFAFFAPTFADDPNFQDKNQIAFFQEKGKNTQIFEGKEANKSNFLVKASNFKNIYINTHGIANDSIGDLSYLRLSDENLYTSELYGMKLQADMVTLSACQTANGELRQGEGTVGLTLGFLYAGAKSVVSSLWNVNQQSTNEFIKSFYQELRQKDMGNNKALHQAKLALIETNPVYAHPKYWAAFVLVGNPDVKMNTAIAFWKYSVPLGLFSFLLIWFYRRQKSK
jgi:CHAT domain-containing protein